MVPISVGDNLASVEAQDLAFVETQDFAFVETQYFVSLPFALISPK